MAALAQMTLQFVENMLNANPGVELFTGYFFSDIITNSGNPNRTQVQNAYQALLDQSKNLGGAVIPNAYPDPSTYSLSGQLTTSGNQAVGNSSANSGAAGQTPQNAITVTQASIAPTPQVLLVDTITPAQVFVAPPNYVAYVKKANQVN